MQKSRDCSDLGGDASVAHSGKQQGNMGNTVAEAVALLPKPDNARATPVGSEKSKPDRASLDVLPLLPKLPAKDRVDDIACAHALLAETFERIAGWWIEGADLPPAELDAEIDRAVVTGDLAALRAALETYEHAARESCACRRAALRQGAEG